MSFQWEKCEAIFPSEWTLTTDVKKTEHTQATQVKIIAEMQQKTIEEEEPLDCSIVDGDTGDGQSPKLFRCNICFQLLTTKQTFKTHYDSLHLGKKITCNFCSKVFTSSGYLKVHIRSVHLKKRDFICKFCPKAFSRKTILKVHENSVHLKNMVFKCSICPKAYHVYSRLKTHTRITHSMEDISYTSNPNVVVANRAPSTSASSSGFKGPSRFDTNRINWDSYSSLSPEAVRIGVQSEIEEFTMHPNSKTSISCRDDVNNSPLTIDKNTIHLKEEFNCKVSPMSNVVKKDKKRFKCSICSKGFDTQGRLKKHEDTAICKRKIFCCNICQKKFSTKFYLRNHRTCKDALNMNKSDAGNKEPDSKSLSKTDETVSIKKKFDDSILLNENGEKVVEIRKKNFKCDICFKGFDSRKRLMKHTESTICLRKVFSCKICLKKFSTKFYLKKHKLCKAASGSEIALNKTVTEEGNKQLSKENEVKREVRKTRYMCDICSKIFYSRRSLKRHEESKVCKRKIFGCNICSKKFSSKFYLKVHKPCNDSNKALNNNETSIRDQKAARELGSEKKKEGSKASLNLVKRETDSDDEIMVLYYQTYENKKDRVDDTKEILENKEESEEIKIEEDKNINDIQESENETVKLDKETLFTCHICKEVFQLRIKLTKHLKVKHSSSLN